MNDTPLKDTKTAELHHMHLKYLAKQNTETGDVLQTKIKLKFQGSIKLLVVDIMWPKESRKIALVQLRVAKTGFDKETANAFNSKAGQPLRSTLYELLK
jgi:hypothetical protein